MDSRMDKGATLAARTLPLHPEAVGMPRLPIAATAPRIPLPDTAPPLALVSTWLMCCYFLIVVVGGVIANVLLLVTTVRWRCWRRVRRFEGAGSGAGSVTGHDSEEDADGAGAAGDSGLAVDRDRGWWFLMAQLAAADALTLGLVSGGELWALRETGGPWRLPASLCAPLMGADAMLGAAQTYLLVAIALHARATPADPVPSVWRQVSRSAVVPSALVWMLASSVAVPRTFLAVAVWPRPSLPLCTLLPTSPTTGALEGPLDVVAPGPAGSWWPLGAAALDGQGGGPVLSAIVLCAVPSVVLLVTALPTALAAILGRSSSSGGSSSRPPTPLTDETCPPHKLARREWVRVSSWLSMSWLLMSLPRLASAAAHGFLPPDHGHGHGLGGPEAPAFGPWSFRAPPLGSRALGDTSLLAASMLHYALTAARPVLTALTSPALRRAFAAISLDDHLGVGAGSDPGGAAGDSPVAMSQRVDC